MTTADIKKLAADTPCGDPRKAALLWAAGRIKALQGALQSIAHCDDLVITGEDDGPELAKRLRFAVNTAEQAVCNE
jgi:hypothetical protein